MQYEPDDSRLNHGREVSPAIASRCLFFGFAAITVVIELAAIGPFGDHRVVGDLMASLLLLPILMAWAIGPYAVANKFAYDASGWQGWVFAGLQCAMSLPALWIYAEVFFFTEGQDPQLGLIFVVIPIYQFVAVIAVYYALRVWARYRGTDATRKRG